MIRHVGKKYIIYSSDGSKRLGEYSSKSEAERRLKQIEYFKNKKK